MAEEDKFADGRIIVEIDQEFLDILKRLEAKIKDKTWDGMEKVGYKTLTRILARKINVAKLL